MNVNDLFKNLVETDSPSGQESVLAEYIFEFCKSRNLLLNKDDEGNIYSVNESPKLLLTAHMDIVQGEEHVEVDEAEGKLKSKGNTILGADDKAGLAGILAVVDHYHTHGIVNPPKRP